MKTKLLSVSSVFIGYMIYVVTSCPRQPEQIEVIEFKDIQPAVVISQPVVQEKEIVVEEEIIEEPIKTNRWNITLTDDEIDMLAKIVFLESHTEPEEGISAVITVILNRVVSPLFPNTLEEVLSQDNPVQFTSWKNIDIAQPTEKEYKLIEAALSGEKEVLDIDYLYFSRGKQNNAEPVKIGRHWFCKQP